MANPFNFHSSEPVNIFQDDFLDPVPMPSHAPMPAYAHSSRRPLSSSSSNVALNPPSAFASSYSPYKAKSSSPRSPLKLSQGNRLNAMPMAPPPGKGPMTDSLQKRPYLSKFKTGPQKHSFDLNLSFGQENVPPPIFPAPSPIDLAVDNCFQKPNGKRMLMDAAPINDSRPPKKTKIEYPGLPPHDSFPTILDNGKKPTLSYAQLIGMAILRSPSRRLTLSQIYKWISDTYSFYGPQDAGWQNSIRHNLSLHKSFIKIERPKDDPGKGNYWAIAEGQEYLYLKEKPAKKAAPTAENLPVMSTRLEPSRPSTAPAPVLSQEPTLPPPVPVTQHSLPPLPMSQPPMSLQPELSSDATILVSDEAAPGDAADKAGENDLPQESSAYSPLPANMHSSPPVPRHMAPRSGTPPPMAQHPTSSAPRTRKRKFASMDDSGYISSLESSAMRPNQKGVILTSDPDRPRFRRICGRAEEEIARIRNSSPYSPTKGRSQTPFGPVSSSPLRSARDNQMLPPLTPKVRIRPPPQPPQSASPDTTLRLHRSRVSTMLQSPLHRVSGTGEDCVPWSPAFKLDESLYNFDDEGFSGDIDIFQDMSALDDSVFGNLGPIDNQSPVKRSAKRARLDRSASTSVLDENANPSARKLITSAPLLKFPEPHPVPILETPSKAFEGLGSPSRLLDMSPVRHNSPSKFSSFLQLPADGDWPVLMLDPSCEFMGNTESSGSEPGGLDILQGFQKIGSGSQGSKQSDKSNKPGLARSYSTNF